MLRKTAAFTLAVATGLITSSVQAEDAPAAAETSPHTTSGNVTFATNYVVRGLTQTNFKPAIQGTFDYSHSSGFYAGLFASNVSWYADGWEPAAKGVNSAVYGGSGTDAISNSLEIDFYGGYRGKVADFSYDVGGIYYYYPGKYEISGNQPTPRSA